MLNTTEENKSVMPQNAVTKKITPSVFMAIHPYCSLLQNSESETIARNLMVILARTDNKFRPISWDEYKRERLKDGNFSESEKGYFKDVKYLARKTDLYVISDFSPAWKKAWDKFEKKKQYQ